MSRIGSIDIILNSQSVENNTSSVTFTGYCETSSTDSCESKSGSYTIKQGSTVLKTGKFTKSAPLNTKTKLFSVTLTIKHDTVGISGTITATFDYNSGWCTGTQSKTLTRIDRSSTLAVENGTLGTEQTLTITKKVSTFKHKLSYSCGETSGWILGDASSFSTKDSVDWTPPMSLAYENTTGTSVSVEFVLSTYTDAGSIVYNHRYFRTFAIPSSVKPSCSITISDPTGYKNIYGAYIKGLSKFKVVVTPTIAYDSLVTSYNTTADGVTYTTSSFTTGVISSYGDLTISATVKDRRGRIGAASETLTVWNYGPPVITKLTVNRCDSDGTENIQGNYVKATFKGEVTSLNNQNSASYVLQYKKTSQTVYPDTQKITFDELENVYSVTDAVYIFEADTGSSYDVKVVVTDNFNTASRTTCASTAFAMFHFSKGGTGLGVGKLAEEENLLDIGLPIRFYGGIQRDTLWSGTWGSGKIVVPYSEKFMLFKIDISGQGTTILAVKHGNYIRGIGGYTSADSAVVTYHFAATISGDIWNFVACNSGNPFSTDQTLTSHTITGITGII